MNPYLPRQFNSSETVSDETERLRQLRTCGILDSSSDPAYNDQAWLALRLCDAEHALVSFLDADRQWIKASVSREGSEAFRNVRSFPRAESFCAHTILGSDLLEVEDASGDDRFKLFPIVSSDPGIRFYAGVPLTNSRGFRLGTLCVLGTQVQRMSEVQRTSLRILGNVLSGLVDRHESQKIRLFNEIAGSIAHEIKNPLSIIVTRAGYVRALADSDRLTQVQTSEFMRGIEAVAMRIDRIVKGMIRAAQAGQTMPTEHVLVNRLVEDTLPFCRGQMERGRIEFRYRAAPADWRMVCQPERISQVLINVINNAIDAIRGEECRWIELEIERDYRLFRFALTDSGPGVPSAIRERIFDPLVSSKSTEEGTGLGLSICRSIIDSHGGRIFLDEESKFTRFVFEVPVGG